MKKLLSIALVLTGIVFVSTGTSTGFAVEAQEPTQPATTQIKPTPTESDISTTSGSKAELNARLEERRNRTKIKLNPAQSAQLKGRCVAAQAKINAISKKLNDDYNPFQTKYEALAKKLQETSQARKASGQDTATLDAQIATLAQKYQVFKTSLDQLNLSVSDLKSVDCVAEPNGFKATLEDTREQRKIVQTNRKDVTKFAKQSIVGTLKNNTEKTTP